MLLYLNGSTPSTCFAFIVEANHLMNRILFLLFFALILLACTENGNDSVKQSIPAIPKSVDLDEEFFVSVEVGDAKNDAFIVHFFGNKLENSPVFQFPAVIPGTYRFSNFGRFVRSFQAYDNNHSPIEVSQLNTNQWLITYPDDVSYFKYEIRETWDTTLRVNPIFRAAGTSIESDHALMNLPAIIGYPEGEKERPYYIQISYPDKWKAGSALQQVDSKTWLASDYDQLADSPILLGKLKQYEISVDGTIVGLSAYQFSGKLNTELLFEDAKVVIDNANTFLGNLLVPEYQFLFHFDNLNVGALEHKQSSVYALRDDAYSTSSSRLFRNIMAHEFFHIVTPLNIQSEIIANYNFSEPVASEHLWFYEGVTEWASRMMQFRGGSLSEQQLFTDITSKIRIDRTLFDPTFSLSDISLKSYTPEGNAQFVNIYNKGALTAFLLDIRLLELSDGKTGLRELIFELLDLYGPNQSFDDEDFFELIVDLTYPEIEEFIQDYIKSAKPLPYQEYFKKIALEYRPMSNYLRRLPDPDPSEQALFDAWSSLLN